MVCNLNVEDSLSGFKHHARFKVCKLRIKILLLLKYKFFKKKNTYNKGSCGRDIDNKKSKKCTSKLYNVLLSIMLEYK
jgi:hypothetical protein